MKKITVFLIFCALPVLCTAQSVRPMVSDINSTISFDNNSIIITWSVSADSSDLIQELLLYKSIDGIISPDSLLSETPLAVLQVNETEYHDFVNDTKKYYYAVIARQKDGTLYDLIIPTVNATTSAIALPMIIPIYMTLSDARTQLTDDKSTVPPTGIQEAPLRQKPLPYLHILTGETSETTSTLNTETLQFTDSLSTLARTAKTLQPDIFPQDEMDMGYSGDDYTLFAIVNSLVSQDNWQAVETELEQFLKINRSEEITARATFYLGQAYYFNQKYRDALFSFQESEKLYPAWSKKWIEEVLNHYLID